MGMVGWRVREIFWYWCKQRRVKSVEVINNVKDFF